MYIPEFWAGVIGCLLTEVGLVIIGAVIAAIRKEGKK